MDEQDPRFQEESEPETKSHRVWPSVVGSIFSTLFMLCLVGGGVLVTLALFHPETPLPPEWNPRTPLAVSDPVTPLTSWKLRQALNDPVQCRAVLDRAAQISVRAPLEVSDNCHIRNRVSLRSVGQARLDELETSCATALRLAMWERHGLQPAAQTLLGSQVEVIRQFGSYSCRSIRTVQGASSRWSTHATADAIDISGFDLVDGRRLRLVNDWQGSDAEALFLRAVRDSACKWFATTLGPEYNSLHADHFHLQSRGWGTCR